MFSFRMRRRMDPLEHVLFPWDCKGRDNFSLRDLCANVCILGRSGSGKTTGAGRRTMQAIADEPNTGMLVSAATREDLGMVRECLANAKRSSDLIVFSPESTARCNFLGTIGKSKGGPREATKLLGLLREALRNGDSKGGENEKFFEDEQNRCIFNGAVAVQMATGDVTAPTLQRFLSDMAQSAAQLADENWRKGFHAQTLRQAKVNVHTSMEQHDLELALEYFLGEMPNCNDRTRSSIMTGVFGTLHVLNSGVVREMCSGGTTFTPEDLFARKWIVCDMPPNVWGGGAGVLVNVGLRYLAQRAILARQVQPTDAVVGLWADEYQQFVSPSYDPHFLATCRSRRGFMVCLTQSVSGLYTALRQAGEHQAKSLLSNFATMIFHASDPTTAEYAVSKLGRQLTTFCGGSTLPQGDIYEDLFGTQKFTGSFNEQYSEVLETAVFQNGLRTGGPACDYKVDGIVIRNGLPFSDGQSWKWVTWDQRRRR